MIEKLALIMRDECPRRSAVLPPEDTASVGATFACGACAYRRFFTTSMDLWW